MSTTITELLCGRFVQAFGGSIGSVLGQAICRDAFHGPELGKIFAIIGSALALFPALGPTLGGIISQNFGWPSIFLFLIILAVLITLLTVMYLAETLIKKNRLKISIYNVATELIKDRRVIELGLIVAGCNGILFSYFAKGSFFLGLAQIRNN